MSLMLDSQKRPFTIMFESHFVVHISLRFNIESCDASLR